MAGITIVIANKAYSSWSLRGWLALRLTGAEFEEIVIPLREANTRSNILKYSPSAKLPALIDGEIRMWESLAIIEYLAEKFPKAGLWPADLAARAEARAIAAEVHGGFIPLRRALPMNMRVSAPCPKLSDAVRGDINRIEAIWSETGRRHPDNGPFLLGDFSAIDAMFAPIVSRFTTYSVDLTKDAAAYAAAVMGQPLMVEWMDAAKNEPWIIPEFEPGNETPNTQ
jgi:glutathione S-transferase